jgi:hypothetical protein
MKDKIYGGRVGEKMGDSDGVEIGYNQYPGHVRDHG